MKGGAIFLPSQCSKQTKRRRIDPRGIFLVVNFAEDENFSLFHDIALLIARAAGSQTTLGAPGAFWGLFYSLADRQDR
jgi:hypothetical protein